MTAPRQVLPGRTYLVSRRCTQRQFLLRPGKVTNDVFLYVLALAVRRYGMRVHAFCVLSNHYHLVLSDPHARLPAFAQFLDALVARALNALHGRWESFWAPSSYSAVELLAPEDVLAKAVYTLANPVAAGLVRSARSWPGLWSGPDAIGTSLVARRPAHFFAANGQLPEEVPLEVVAPAGFQSAEAFRRSLGAALEEKEGALRQGRHFLGASRILAQKATGRPVSGDPRRQLDARVAAGDKWKRVEALVRAAEFVRAYREAWHARRAGALATVFPAGTYLLRVLHGVPCAACG